MQGRAHPGLPLLPSVLFPWVWVLVARAGAALRGLASGSQAFPVLFPRPLVHNQPSADLAREEAAAGWG